MYQNLPPHLQASYTADPRLKMAQALQGRAFDTSPAHPIAAMGRALAGYMGGRRQKEVDQDYRKRGEDYKSAMSRALLGLESGDYSAFSDPALGPYGPQFAMQGVKQRADRAAEDRKFGRQKELADYKANIPVPGRNAPYSQDVLNQKIEIAREQAAATRMPPAGYQLSNNRLEPIPGGPEDPQVIRAQTDAKKAAESEAKKKSDFPKARDALLNIEAQHKLVIEDIDYALELVESAWLATGLGAAVWSEVPGTPSHDLARILDTIRANIGFDKLQAMRDASPTGGALGQVSEMENRLLQSTSGNLEQKQSAQQLKRNLLRIKQIVTAGGQRKRKAYESDFSEFITESPPEAPAQGGWSIQKVD